MDYGILSIIPPILTITLALKTKNVFISLFSGVFLAYLIFAKWSVIEALNTTLYSFVKVLEDNDNVIIIFTVLFLGGLIHLIEISGGISGFVAVMTKKRGMIKSKKSANIFTWILGVLMFTSGTLSSLVVGSVSRPINDAMKVPHEKAAFIVHTTSTPVCVLIPLSGWGASMIGYMTSAGVNPADATKMLVETIPLNFYAIIAVLSVLFFAITGKDFGPMKKAEQRANETGLLDDPKSNPDVRPIDESILNVEGGKAINLIVPILTLITVILTVLIITGKGNLIEGSGMTAILWGVVVSNVVAATMYVSQKRFTITQVLDEIFKGSGSMLSMAMVLIFAFSMGSVIKELDTGGYLANLFESFLTPGLLPALTFLMAAIISFATGTSLGTMAITMVIALPMAASMGEVNASLVAAAVIGGSIFGDHSSPISDTTIMCSSTTGCNVMDHVKTQLPYCLVFAAISFVLYLVAGLIL